MMNRLPSILRNAFTDAQHDLFTRITGGKRGENRTLDTFLTPEGGMRGPFNALLYSSRVGDAVQQLGQQVRFETSLPATLRELAILCVAAKWHAQYEWWAHEKIARYEGLDSTVIASVKAGTSPTFTRPAEAIVFRFSQELLEQQRVSESCYTQAIDLLGEAGVVELVALLGYYTLISMILNTFEVPVPEGKITPFSH
jgi:4-carboxymuconolactone decarboxylase